MLPALSFCLYELLAILFLQYHGHSLSSLHFLHLINFTGTCPIPTNRV